MQQKTDIISCNIFSHFFYQEGNDDSENYKNVEIHNVSTLKRKRVNIMGRFRSKVAGKDVESRHIQQKSELKILSRKSKLNICHKSGVKQRSYLSNKVALAIKTVTGMSWTQHRLHQRFLREAKAREERKHFLADHLCSKVIQAKERDDKSADSVEGFSSTKARLVYVRDLSKFL